MTTAKTVGAVSSEVAEWYAIDWQAIHHNVRRLQVRIAKATKVGRWGKVRALQRLLTNSYSGKVLAVRRVTENDGNKTPGVDQEFRNTRKAGFTANIFPYRSRVSLKEAFAALELCAGKLACTVLRGLGPGDGAWPLGIASLRHLLGWMLIVFRSREDLALENLALRRQLLALHAQRPRRRSTDLHKLFWVALRTFWSGWTKPLILVTPRTVVNWHRAGFSLYWTWMSRVSRVGGRKRVSKEVRALIFRMVSENPTWGAPRIHGELLKLGFDLSERSVSRWIRRAPRDPDSVKRWLTFLRNHREAMRRWISSPSQRSRLAFCTVFSIIGHDRRKILHFNVTRNPNTLWVVQQLREAWAYKQPHRFLLFDRDAKFGIRGDFGGEGHWKRANSHGLSQSIGRTALPSAGWAVADAICLIT